MLDLDQRPQPPIGLASSNGLDVGRMVGAVGAYGISIAILEILLRIVPNGFNQIFEAASAVGSSVTADLALDRFGTIVAVVLRKENRLREPQQP